MKIYLYLYFKHFWDTFSSMKLFTHGTIMQGIKSTVNYVVNMLI